MFSVFEIVQTKRNQTAAKPQDRKDTTDKTDAS